MTEPLQLSGLDRFAKDPDIELVRPKALTEQALIEAVRDVEGIAVRSAKLTPRVVAAARDLDRKSVV